MNFEFILIFVSFSINLCNGCWSSPKNKDKDKDYKPLDRVYDHYRILSAKDKFNLHHAFTFDDMKWTNNTVIYEIDNAFDSVERERLFEGMAEIQNSSCIRFEPFNESQHTDYLAIGKDYARSRRLDAQSVVGRHYGRQYMWFGSDRLYNFDYHFTILHELLHTLGFYHHHERSDRDKYIEFITENMANLSLVESNYLKQVHPDPQMNFTTPFDFDSVLLYDAFKDSKNGEATIISKIAGKQVPPPEHHANQGLSMYDKILLNKFYSCTED